MVDRLGAGRTGKNQARGRCQERSTRSHDRRLAGAIGFRGQRAAGSLARRARSPISGAIRVSVVICSAHNPSSIDPPRRPMARQSSHVRRPQLMNSATTVNCTLAAAHFPERSSAGRARPSTARRLTQRTVSESQSKTSHPGSMIADREVGPQFLSPRKHLDSDRSAASAPVAGSRADGTRRTKRNDREYPLFGAQCLDIQILPGYTIVQSRPAE